MKYSVNYQYRPKGKTRPTDDGTLIPIEIDDTTNLVLLPNIGDHVHIGASKAGESSTEGRVASRFFMYQEMTDGGVHCHVNMVIEECDDSVFAQLIKE
ncbi:MAG: hypothetical protein ACKO8N_05155 [Rubrivivax sp.]